METNDPFAQQTTVSSELEDKILAVLPPAVSHWLRYESPSDLDVVQIFKAWRAGSTEQHLLCALRGHARRQTRAVYGADHPQASFT